jgi:hypothetical protein
MYLGRLSLTRTSLRLPFPMLSCFVECYYVDVVSSYLSCNTREKGYNLYKEISDDSEADL